MAVSVGPFVLQEKDTNFPGSTQRHMPKACACRRAAASKNQYCKGRCYSNHIQSWSSFSTVFIVSVKPFLKGLVGTLRSKFSVLGLFKKANKEKESSLFVKT